MHSFNYKNNEASKDEILNHLKSCDELFNPRLSASVDIPVYAQKIKNNAATFEAWHNNELVGLIACYLNDINKLQGHITNVSILKEYQGKGISKQLLAQTILKGKELGFKTLSLDVEVSNKKAISLYQKCGFDLTGRNGSKYNMINRLNENRNVLVSICCITYNHENFIEAALNGFLLQKTNFAIEIIIHDDASTDGTAEILKEYKERYPHLFQIILQVENQLSKGINPFFEYVASSARGKYIALCEGDDYWTDPYKLQKQVDILEGNKDCSICFTDAKTYIQDKHKLIPNLQRNSLTKNKFDIYDLSKKHYIYTPTVLFINKQEHFPKRLFNHIGGDTTLFLLLLEDGSKAIFLPEETTVYREHSGGVFSGRNSFPYARRKVLEEGMVKMIQAWIDHFHSDKCLVKIFRKRKLSALNKLRVIALENKDGYTIRKSSKEMLGMFSLENGNVKLWLSVLISFLFPEIHGNYISKNIDKNA